MMDSERKTYAEEWLGAERDEETSLTPEERRLAGQIQNLGKLDHPEAEFVARAASRLAEAAHEAGRAGKRRPGEGQLFRHRARQAWRWGVGLGVMALLAAALIFSMDLLSQSAGAPGPALTPERGVTATNPSTPTYVVQEGDTWGSIAAAHGVSVQDLRAWNGASEGDALRVGQRLRVRPADQTQSTAEATPDSSVLPTETEALSLTPNRLITETCTIPASEALGQDWVPPSLKDRVGTLAGGGSREAGNFTIGLWLACDPSFSHQNAGGDQYSEIDGLGVLSMWRYHGPDMEGKITEYTGIEPYVREGGGSGPVENNPAGFSVNGLQFPSGVMPDFSQTDTGLRYVFKVRTPDGALAGVALSFTLQRLPDGFQPVDIHVDPLSETELQTAESDPSATPAFIVKDPLEVYPELKEVRQLLDYFNEPLRSAPGWVHLVTRQENPGGNGLYGDLTEWLDDSWYQIDERGYVVSYLLTEHTEDGRVLQQSHTRDGQSINTTYGTTSDFSPYAFDLGSSLYDDLFQRLRSGKPMDRSAETVNGRPAWIYTFGDSFAEPTDVNGTPTTALEQREAIDQETGSLLFTEMWRTTESGEEQLVWRLTYESIERVDEPPAEVLDAFEQKFQGYQPAAPEGTPAPSGFDASQSELTLRSIPGDSFEQPSFFYGDIYAGGYLLGRVDFGAISGGWCDRSADGSRLAFVSVLNASKTESHEHLRWLDLGDVSQVHDPAPELELTSQIAWAPQGGRLAFTACKSDKTGCGLYVLDTDAGQLTLLSTAGLSYAQPVWKPDASQIAFMSPEADNVYKLFVVDAANGKTVYSGGFDIEAWQPAADAPTREWGGEIPHGSSGNSCFASP